MSRTRAAATISHSEFVAVTASPTVGLSAKWSMSAGSFVSLPKGGEPGRRRGRRRLGFWLSVARACFNGWPVVFRGRYTGRGDVNIVFRDAAGVPTGDPGEWPGEHPAVGAHRRPSPPRGRDRRPGA